jgi:biopolymer transport protein ExbB
MWNWFLAGGPVMWPLLLCSLISLTVSLERLFFWMKANIGDDASASEKLLEDYRQHGPDWRPFPSPGSLPPGAVLGMLLNGLAHREFSASKAMEAVALTELKKMRRGMNILDTMITVAPMLGILGTVTGIITSFDMLGQAGVEDPRTVVAGIAEALITTMAGLSISVASLLPYNYFTSLMEDAQDLFEHYGTRLEILQDKFDRNGGAKR